MANRAKTGRNQKILEYWEKGYRQISIANIFRMKEGAVRMVISREKKHREIAQAGLGDRVNRR